MTLELYMISLLSAGSNNLMLHTILLVGLCIFLMTGPNGFPCNKRLLHVCFTACTYWDGGGVRVGGADLHYCLLLEPITACCWRSLLFPRWRSLLFPPACNAKMTHLGKLLLIL
jgi:hypothetical protein